MTWDDWYEHTVTIEPLMGSGGMGDIYGAPVQTACMIDDTRRLVRGADAVETVSETTLLCPPGTIAPPGSRITLPSGRVTTVITTSTQDVADPDLTGVEVALQ